MGKYYTYEGKQVGFFRKSIDEVVLVEESWVSEVQNYFGKKGHDTLLAVPAKLLKDAGFPEISRAQAWIILLEILNKGVPDALQNASEDESVGKGSLWKDIAKTPVRAAATVVDTTVSAGSAVVGAGVGAGSAVVDAVKPAKIEEVEEVEEVEEAEVDSEAETDDSE